MSEKKSKTFTIGLILVIIGILFLVLLFQMLAFTGTAFVTPQQFKDEVEEKYEKDEVKEGDSWWVYGWVSEKLEKDDNETVRSAGFEYGYIFKKDIASESSEEDKVGFFSNNSYMVGTDILVEIKIQDGMYVESNRLAFPIPEVPGIVFLLIGLILLFKGRKARKGAKEKLEKEQGGMFSQDDMAGFTQSPDQYPQPPGQLSQQYPGGGYSPPPGQMQQQPFSQPPQGAYGSGQSQPPSYGQPSTFTSPTHMPGPSNQPPQTPPSQFPSSQPPQGPQMPFPQQNQPPPQFPSSQPPQGQQSPEIHQGNVGVPMYVKCPACGEKMPAPPIRPARVQCQKCGTKGTIN